MHASIHSVFISAAALLIACCAEAQTSGSESYLCSGEQAMGFGMNSKTRVWSAQKFRSRNFIIRVPIKGPTAPSGAYSATLAVYEVGKVNAANATAFCDKGYNDKGYLFCTGLGEELNFNRDTMRFVHWFPFGYIDPPESSFWGKEGEATPFMEIGKCTAI